MIKCNRNISTPKPLGLMNSLLGPTTQGYRDDCINLIRLA